jgi:hypothetical protein
MALCPPVPSIPTPEIHLVDTNTKSRLLSLLPMIYGAILYHKDRTSYAGLSAYINPVYNLPSGHESTHYDGAPVPRPDFVDLEDGQGHGFLKKAKSRRDRVQRKEAASDGQSENLMSKVPGSA